MCLDTPVHWDFIIMLAERVTKHTTEHFLLAVYFMHCTMYAHLAAGKDSNLLN